MSEPEPLPAVGRTTVRSGGRQLAFFAGCDYFRLSSHPRILRAVRRGLEKYGLNVAASRVTTGNHALYRELETALARFFKAPAALVVSNGYATNMVAAQALRGEVSHVLIDDKAHVSLWDASRIFGCPIFAFRNRQTSEVRRLLRGLKGASRPILLTDGVYTYEGEVAPLAEYLKILGPRGLILVDDAHGAGVLGRTGRGTVELAGVSRERVIQTVTLSKAFGVYGGAVLCTPALREKMVATSAMFAGSTPLPLPLAYAAMESLRVVGQDKSLLARLNRNALHVKNTLRAAGQAIPDTPVPVVAVTPRDGVQAEMLRKKLLRRGIYPSFIKYPGGPEGGYLRIVISSEHTRKQLDALLSVLA